MRQVRSIVPGLLMCMALLLVAHSQAFAQSSYNLFGFGEPIITHHGRLEGLGGSGIGLTEGRIVSDLNPASWSWLTRARLETSFRFDRTTSEFEGQNAVGNDFKFDGLSFGAPVWSKYMASIALSFAPLTNASYELIDQDSQTTKKYVSEGGVSLASLGGSIMPLNGLAVAGKLDVFFGNVRHLSSLTFDNDPSISESQFSREYAVNGVRGTFGLLLQGDSLSESLGGLTLGFVFSTPADLSMTRRTTSLVALKDTIVEDEGEGYYPSAIGAGLTYTFDRRYRILADVHSQDFSQAVVYTQDASQGDPNLQAMTRISAGFEIVPNISSEFGAAGGLTRWGFRVGAFYATTPFAPLGDGVTELGGSIGIGIPMLSESILDFSFTIGQRRPTEAISGPKDLFIRAGATIALAERWFNPTRRNE